VRLLKLSEMSKMNLEIIIKSEDNEHAFRENRALISVKSTMKLIEQHIKISMTSLDWR